MNPALNRFLKEIGAAQERFDAARVRYSEFQRQASAGGNRIEWWSGYRQSIVPFELERFGLRPGRILSGEPKSRANKASYTFDRNGQLLLEERYDEYQDRKHETFWIPRADNFDGFLFGPSPSKPLINTSTLFRENALPLGYIRVSPIGAWAEAYEYSNGVLTRVIQSGWEFNEHSAAHEPVGRVDKIVYRDLRPVEIVRSWESGGVEHIQI